MLRFTRRETISLLKCLSRNAYLLTPIRQRKDWLEERRKYVGASDASAILGKSPWRTAKDIYYDKIDDKLQRKNPVNESIEIGIESESHIRDLFSIETGLPVIDCTGMLMQSTLHSFMSCTLDGCILSEDRSSAKVLEIKSVSTMKGWEGDNIPDHYLIQLVHQLIVTGWKEAVLLARFRCSSDFSFPGREKLYLVNIEDHAKLARVIIDKERQFMNYNVYGNVPPSVALPEL